MDGLLGVAGMIITSDVTGIIPENSLRLAFSTTKIVNHWSTLIKQIPLRIAP